MLESDFQMTSILPKVRIKTAIWHSESGLSQRLAACAQTSPRAPANLDIKRAYIGVMYSTRSFTALAVVHAD